jgi:RluA family pseudouridine synthase
MLSIRVISEHHGAALVDYLAHAFGISKKKAKASIDARQVFVNRKRVWMAKYKLSAGDLVECQEEQSAPKKITVPVLWESSALIVVNKPSGILSEGGKGGGDIEQFLRQSRGEKKLRLIHRLDRDTSGCLLLARNDAVFERMKQEFEQHRVKKIYRALVSGIVERDTFKISTPIDGKSAHSSFKVLRRSTQASELEIAIETGRMHQIRKHILEAGHQVLGDKQYGDPKRLNDAQRNIPRQMLHAEKIVFTDPTSDERIEINAPLPSDYQAARRTVGLS